MRRQNAFIFRKSYCLLLFFVLGINGFAQENKYINPADPSFREKYEHLSFDNKFVLLADSDLTNNYFLADFSKFSSKFEKVYFLSLVFTSERIVNIDGELKYDKIWFMANRKFTEQDVIAEFERLKEKTIKTGTSMSEEAKVKWLSENDKYK